MERRSCFDRVDVTVKDPSAAIRVQHDSPTLSRWIPSILAIAILVRTLCTCLIVRNMTNGATDPANCSDDTAASTFDAALPPVEASSSSTSASPPVLAVVVPQVLDRCSVRWRNGELLRAEIIEIRPSRSYLSKMNRKRKCDESSSSSAAMAAAAAVDPSLLTNPDDIDYYVHYVGHDRRLDEWIAYGAIQPGSLQRGGALSTASAVAGGGGGLAEQQPHDLNLLQQHSGLPMRRRSSGALNTASSFDAGGSGGVSSGGGSFHGSDDGVINSGGGGNWHAPDPSYEREHEETTKVKNVERIIMGRHAVQCWYYSQFPEAYHNLPVLYVCEFCLSYMKKLRTYRSHMCTCPVRHPPGRRIYQEGDLSVYEIDGKDNKAFCQKLCLIAKLFLDHKTLYYDVNPFLFYVVCLDDIKGSRMVGYFSKEKVSDQGYNLACILTLPQYQTRGYGKFIISLSYELTKREGKTGSPEKPLSDLGKVSYRSYWTHVLLGLLSEHDPHDDISVAEMSRRTGINPDDIISTLQSLDLVKVWKGQHVALIKQSMLRSYLTHKYVDSSNNHEVFPPEFRQCKPEFLDWQPSNSLT